MTAENHYAVWIPSTEHSWNRVGKAAAECNQTAVAYFDFLTAVCVLHRLHTLSEVLTDSLNTGI